MSGSEVNGLDSLPDGIQSADTTLEDLLKDESLGNRPDSNNMVDEDQRHYQDCLAVFIGGQFEEALQKMYEYGFLSQESLQTTHRNFDLFLEACNSIKSYKRLGFRLQDAIHETFTGDSQIVQEHLNDTSQKSQASTWNKYYRCCVKTLLMDQPADPEKSMNLENGVRRTISKLARELHGSEEAPELEELVETYIFGIQIEVLQKPRSTALYKRLCYHVPSLGSQLSTLHSIHKGKNIEEYILSKLETKPIKTKKQSRQHSKSMTENKLNISTNKTPLAARTSNVKAIQVVPKWKSLWPKYFSKLHLSRQNLLFLLFFLLVSLQSVKKLVKIPRFFTNFLRTLAPQLRNLMKLLSSI